jgi:hypothetical protein
MRAPLPSLRATSPAAKGTPKERRAGGAGQSKCRVRNYAGRPRRFGGPDPFWNWDRGASFAPLGTGAGPIRRRMGMADGGWRPPRPKARMGKGPRRRRAAFRPKEGAGARASPASLCFGLREAPEIEPSGCKGQQQPANQIGHVVLFDQDRGGNDESGPDRGEDAEAAIQLEPVNR